MNTTRIDLANIGLMVFSCVAAYLLPFELFLLSYAVLGPLHYLTEISWLHKRDYFANSKKDYMWLLVAGILLTVLTYISVGHNSEHFGSFLGPLYQLLTDVFGPNVFYFSTTLIFVAFCLALAMVVFKDTFARLLVLGVALVIGIIFQTNISFVFLFGVFLPTLIHVCIFTGLFILSGTLKNKSITGVLSLVVFVVCACSFFFFQPTFGFYKVSAYAQKALSESTFINLNESIFQVFKLGEYTRENIFNSAVGLAVMRFIAFAYTYHYLNWFSKTQVIKWHQVPKKQLAIVIGAWVASVALYAYNYYVGLMFLYFLSMLHVLLEFPLNYRSIIGIGQDLGTLTGLRKPVAVKKPARAPLRKAKA